MSTKNKQSEELRIYFLIIEYFPLSFVIAVIICIILCAVRSWLFILYPYNKYLTLVWFFLSVIISSATIFATFRISFNSLLWVTLVSVAVERLIFVAVFELLFLFVFHSVLYVQKTVCL